MSPKSDLEAQIREGYRLLREYEETARLSPDPAERLRCRKKVDEQWKWLRQWLGQYRRLGVPLPEDIAQIAELLPDTPETAPPPAGHPHIARVEGNLRRLAAPGETPRPGEKFEMGVGTG